MNAAKQDLGEVTPPAEALSKVLVAGTSETDTKVPSSPRRRYRTGLGGRLFLLLFGVIIALLIYGLSGRPIALPVWVVAEIEIRMNNALQPIADKSAISLGGVEVMVDGDWSPRIRLEDLRLLKADGGALLSLPELQTTLDAGGLIRGRFQMRSLQLTGAHIAIRRDRDGNYDFALGSGGFISNIKNFSQVFDLVDQALAYPVAASIGLIEAEALTLELTDEKLGRTWHMGDGRLTIENRPDDLAAEIGLSLLNGNQGTGRAVLTVISQKATDAAQLIARIDDVAAQDIAAQSPLLAPLAVLDAPISGRIATRLTADGITGFEGNLDIGTGALRPTDAAKPIAFNAASFALRYEPVNGRVVLSNLRVDSRTLRLQADGQSYLVHDSGHRMAGPLGRTPVSFLTQINLHDVRIDPEGLFQEPVRFSDGALEIRLRTAPFSVDIGQFSLADESRRMTVKGKIGADVSGWTVALDMKLNEISHDKLVSLWPIGLLPRTREWVVRSILKGHLFNVVAALRSTPGVEPRLHLGYSFADADVRFVASLPPVQNGSGYSTIDGKAYTVVMTGGQIQPPHGGAIDVSGSVFALPDITSRPVRAEIDMKTRSSLTGALSLLDQPPFNFMTKAELPVDLGEGEARIETRLRLPLQRKILLKDVDYDVTGTVTGFYSDRLVAGRSIMADSLSIAADPSGMTIAGPGLFDGVPFDVSYHQGFEAAEKGRARIEGSVTLSESTAGRLGLGLPKGMISGQAVGQMTIALEKGKPGRLHLISDLNRMGLSLPEIGWSKPAATIGLLEVNARLGMPPDVESLVLDAPGLRAAGSVTVNPDGGLGVARFDKVMLGDWLQGAVEIRGRGAGRPVGLSVTSGNIDLRRMPGAESGRGKGAGGGPISINLDRLVITSGIALTGFIGDFTLAGGFNGEFQARVNGGAPVQGTVVPSRGGSAVRLSAPDAGAALRDAGIFASARGGRLSLQLVPRATAGIYDGQAQITNVRLRNTNILAELLNAISVVGLLQQLSGEGIAFHEVNGEFIITRNVIQITQSSAIGASLGVSLAGIYQTATGALDMQGVISPIYMLNGIGAALTRRGEGVFGFNWHLGGTATNPDVRVNPLSILTPGMFREIFRRPPPVLREHGQ